MERPEYNIIIPPEIRFDQNLNFTEKVLLCEIAYYGNCWKSDGYFAELYGMSRQQVNRVVGQLVEKGYLKEELTYDKEQNTKKRVLRASEELANKCATVANKCATVANKCYNNIEERISKSKLDVNFSCYKEIIEKSPFFNDHLKVKEPLLNWLYVLKESEHSKYFGYNEENFKEHISVFVKLCKYKNIFSDRYAIELINTATYGDPKHPDPPYGKLWWQDKETKEILTKKCPQEYVDAPVRLV